MKRASPSLSIFPTGDFLLNSFNKISCASASGILGIFNSSGSSTLNNFNSSLHVSLNVYINNLRTFLQYS